MACCEIIDCGGCMGWVACIKKSFPPYEYILAQYPPFYDIILISLRYYLNMVIIYTKKISDRLTVVIYHSLSLFIASLLCCILCSSFDIPSMYMDLYNRIPKSGFSYYLSSTYCSFVSTPIS